MWWIYLNNLFGGNRKCNWICDEKKNREDLKAKNVRGIERFVRKFCLKLWFTYMISSGSQNPSILDFLS